MKSSSNQKNFYSGKVVNRAMHRTELEKIAAEFPDLIYCESDRTASTEEFLAYNDDWSIITASVNNKYRRDPKTIVYFIKSELGFYLTGLKTLNTGLAKRIIEAIENSKSKKDFNQDFGVDNFEDLPGLIRLHKKLKEELEGN